MIDNRWVIDGLLMDDWMVVVADGRWPAGFYRGGNNRPVMDDVARIKWSQLDA